MDLRTIERSPILAEPLYGCQPSRSEHYWPLFVVSCLISMILVTRPSDLKLHKLNRLIKLTIFHTFILSNFNFCPLAWHFCTEKKFKKIEKAQERALRFVYEDYNSSYDHLLKKAKVPSLQIRRMRTMALETFKIMNKLSPLCLHNLVHLRNSKYYFRYNNILDIPFHRSEHQGMAKNI